MVNYTVLEFETEVIREAERLNLDNTFKKGMSFNDCASVILLIDNNTMSREQLNHLATKNLIKIKNQFSFKGLRIWIYSITHDSILDINDDLKHKYDNLIDDIISFHNDLINGVFNTTLEYYIYQSEIKKAYNNEFGLINDYDNSLYAMLKTIHDTFYDETVIESLIDFIDDMLYVCGDKYYRTKDLTDITVLKALYEHIGEEAHDKDLIRVNQLFMRDDGYGNSFYESEPYHKPTIDDFKRW